MPLSTSPCLSLPVLAYPYLSWPLPNSPSASPYLSFCFYLPLLVSICLSLTLPTASCPSLPLQASLFLLHLPLSLSLSLISPFSPHFLCFYAHPVVMYFHLLFFSMPYQLFKWTLQCLAFFGKVSAYGFQFLKLASHKEKINNSDISAYGKHKKHIW